MRTNVGTRRLRGFLALWGMVFLPGCLIAQGGFEQELYLQPGDTINLDVGVGGCCYFILPLPIPALWSVSPIAEGASVNPVTGVLRISPDTPHGSIFTVNAGARQVTVYIYEPAQNPLVNTWREDAQFECDGGAEVNPEDAASEIIFLPNGEFSVTWHPFEVYKDYWGTYIYDLEAGTLEMTIDNGNYIPEDFDGSGTFTVDDEGRIELHNIWLGMPSYFPVGNDGVTSVVHCGHRLVAY